MTGIGPRLLAATTMLSLTATMAMTLPPNASPTSTGVCASAKRWVKQNVKHLPTTYEEYASYPVTYRKVIYANLPFQTRVRLWQAHLDHFVMEHDLTPAQTALIRGIRVDITRYLDPAAFAKDTLVLVRVREVLGEELTKDAIMNLVPLRKADLTSEACSCSTVHENCPSGYGCRDTGCDPVACGAFGHDTCNGTCNTPQ